MKTYCIDGAQFSNLPEFFNIIEKTLIPDTAWGRNLDAFDDILRGGFGTPDEGFELVWKNSSISRVKLGYTETYRLLLNGLSGSHPANVEHVKKQIVDAQNEVGQTIFDWLVEIIQSHGPSGEEAEDNVILRLE